MWQVKHGLEHAYEVVTVSDEGRFLVPAGEAGLVEYGSHQVEEVCDLCQEPPTADDPLGHFKHPLRFGGYTLAHGQCGLDRELEPA